MLLSFLSRTAFPVLAMPRTAKRAIAISVDISLCVFAVWLAYYLRLGTFSPLNGPSLMVAGVSIVLALPLFWVFGLYQAIFRYSGLPALMSVGQAMLIYTGLFATLFTAIGFDGVPRTLGLIQPMVLLLAVGASRVAARLWLSREYLAQISRRNKSRLMIYGAGAAGRQLASALSENTQVRVVGYLDDDDRLHGHTLNGLPIYSPEDLADLVVRRNVTDVLLAMPSISRTRRSKIIERIRPARVAVRTLPNLTDLAQGKVSVTDVRDLDIDELLGRQPVMPNHILLAKNITRKVVMVTGAGGSIGSELCRQIVAADPAVLLLVEQNEYALYSLHGELEADLSNRPEITLVPLLASVLDDERMREIIATWKPVTIYHAAAYKHVPLVEHNPAEGIKNNVLGTLTLALLAQELGVVDFVLISTDKAVRPTNVMGASKRLAEMIIQALNAHHEAMPSRAVGGILEQRVRTRFSMVRFGNVLGSSGSVVPKFRQQIKAGGPVTVTHTEINRYFMTIPEAAQLVIQAGAMATGGDVFVLDMGEPVKIIDLARRMIELSGLTVRDTAHPDGDIEIMISGLRPGEKLNEELLIGDNPSGTKHPRILRAQDDFIPWPELEEHVRTLQVALSVNDVMVIRRLLENLVGGYRPSADIVDWVYREQLRTGRAEETA